MMIGISLFNKKVARSIFYIIFVGGLLCFSSFLLMTAWNNALRDLFSLSQITFLESTGIIALFYVVFFGIKFGLNQECDKTAEKNATKNHTYANMSSDVNSNIVQNINRMDKEELKHFVGRCCGFQSDNNLN